MCADPVHVVFMLDLSAQVKHKEPLKVVFQ